MNLTSKITPEDTIKDVLMLPSIWCGYLKKYTKFDVYRDNSNIYCIRCKYGFLMPYCISKRLIVAVLDFKSQKGLNSIIRKLNDSLIDYEITQEGVCDICIVFKEKDLQLVKRIFAIKRCKKPVSQKARGKLPSKKDNAFTDIATKLTRGEF